MGAGRSVITCQPADAEFFRERDQKIHAAAEIFSRVMELTGNVVIRDG